MTTVLLHYPNVYSNPVGAWWWSSDSGSPVSFYLPDYENLQIDGKGMLQNVVSEPQFLDFGQRLVDGMPFVVGWGWGEVSDSSSPEELLTTLQKKAS